MDGAQFMQLNSPRSRSAPSSASLPAMPHSDMAYAVLQIEPRSQVKSKFLSPTSGM